MSANITAEDLTVKDESVYAPLVPSAKVETPLPDQYGDYTGKTMVVTADADLNNYSSPDWIMPGGSFKPDRNAGSGQDSDHGRVSDAATELVCRGSEPVCQFWWLMSGEYNLECCGLNRE